MGLCANKPARKRLEDFLAKAVLLPLVLFISALLWAKSRDPFHREWLSLRTADGTKFPAVVVMPDRGGPFPVVVWCHGAGGSMESSGETLRQFASLGLVAVGFEYDKTNQANFDAQFEALLSDIRNRPWGTKQPLTPSLSLSDEERVAEGRVRAPPLTINHQPSTALAWVGNSLGAQRQLSFLARHPERQPAALVRLNGGRVEEMGEKAGKHSTFNAQPSTSKAGRSDRVNGLNGECVNEASALEATNRKSQIANRKFPVWLAHGENDEVFPADDARAVAEALRGAGADVQLDVFPGRGHGFGEDQPLLIRRAAEFCAAKLGTNAITPDNCRPSLWFYWSPGLLLGLGLGVWGLGGKFDRPGRKASSRWMKVLAGTALIVALAVSAAHLGLPLFRARPMTIKFARQWCVRPELRADFDWMLRRPEASECRLRDLLDSLNLAQLQRGQFSGNLNEDEWRNYVLSPWITEGASDVAWRRELWEWMAPRVRRETDVLPAAQVIVRELRRRVLISEAGTSRVCGLETWKLGVGNASDLANLNVAAFRAAGLPCRRVDAGVELLVGGVWRKAPEPIITCR